MEIYISIGQGFYYFVTGIWPLLSIETFIQVTGPKTDIWLVKTVGVLVTVIGAALISAGLWVYISPEVLIIALGSALGLMLIDVVYVLKKVISRIYLLDAAAELVLVIGWLLALIIF